MKYVDEFRDATRARKVLAEIGGLARGRDFTFMEVCGTHTMSIARYGLRGLLPDTVRLVSGPGCPVCVTPKEYVDHALALALLPDVTVATFGDMMRVPGSRGDLARARAAGADVRVVYSPRDALAVAAARPERRVVFLGVGFETTAPAVAATVREAAAAGLHNYYVLVAHKVIPPALAALCDRGDLGIDGFLCPPHVSAVIGSHAYDFVPRRYGVACAVAGFEPVDILYGLLLLLRQLNASAPRVDNGYSRVVREDGNPRARAVLDATFESCDSRWRGIGDIPASGLRLKEEFAAFDAASAFAVDVGPTTEDVGCLCGDVLTGTKTPRDCPLFGTSCTPETAVGPCMVSSEGTCAAAFKYGL